MSITATELLDYLYYKKLPQVYRDEDAKLMTYPLKRYLSSLIEGGAESLLNDINTFLDLINPEKCPKEFLPAFCKSFGLEYFEDIDATYQRRFLSNIGELIKRRGTYSCVKYFVSALTGLDAELQLICGEYQGKKGKHLIITLLADTIERVMNIGTSVSVVERYIKTQVPFYINPHVVSRVATQKSSTKIYKAGVISSCLTYKILPSTSY